MKNSRRPVVAGVIAVAAVAAHSVPPAGAYQFSTLSAPVFINEDLTLLQAYGQTGLDVKACNDPSRDPCVGTFLELAVYLDNRWFTLGRTDAPNGGLTPDRQNWKWFTNGTCVTGAPERVYRSYIEQKYKEGSITILTESSVATRTHSCAP